MLTKKKNPVKVILFRYGFMSERGWQVPPDCIKGCAGDLFFLMSTKVLSAAVVGVEAYVVEVEAARTSGLRSFTIVGLGDAAVKEARERVHAALKVCELEFPRGHISVNLAPADLKKQGTSYDLPIALAILGTVDAYQAPTLAGKMVVGELALDGSVRPVSCVLVIALGAKAAGLKELFVPKENALEAAMVAGLAVYPVESLGQLMRHLRGDEAITPIEGGQMVAPTRLNSPYDLTHVRGQESVKRALEIAAAGSHNILLHGPPGTGKTLLARTLPTIMPPLTTDDALEITKIHSVAGLLPHGTGIMIERPFRTPHHTTSGVALVGGGANPRPGEVSLAHRGVLFLDEFPEFNRCVLEALRQPLEDGVITISRAAGTLKFPAEFMLVAAMNPCPCGFASDPTQRCICTTSQLQLYRKKISGPLLDRIDLVVDVPKISFEKLHGDELGETSSEVGARVGQAREIQRERLRAFGCHTNRQMTTPMLKMFCQLDDEGVKFMRSAMERLKLSARAFTRVLKVARTIADLTKSERIDVAHVAEALQFRPKQAGITAT